MDILPKRVREMREERDWSQAELARRVGTSQQSINKLEAGGIRQPRYLIKLAEVFETTPQQLLGENITNSPSFPIVTHKQNTPILSTAKDLPVYASAAGGDGSMVISYSAIEWVERPAPLNGVVDAYAMYVVGDSMAPRYNHGDLLLVHPTKPYRQGDDVLVVFKNGDEEYEAVIKQFDSRRQGVLKLKQHNPEKALTFKNEIVSTVHRIVGVYWR